MTTALLSLSRLVAPTEPPQGTRITEARQALDDWARRESDLPWHRRAARREARTMIATFRAQLIVAHLDRWGLRAIARLLAPILDTHRRSGRAHVRSLAFTSMRRTALGRRLLFSAGSVAAVALVGAAFIVVLVTHLVAV